MATEKNLRESLLQQDNFDSRTAAELRDKILARDQASVRRMKRIAGICWAAFGAVFFLAAFTEYFRDRAIPFVGYTIDEIGVYFPEVAWFTTPVAIIVVQALFILAVATTFSLHMRSRTLTMHQIQSRLAVIEEQLRKLAERS